VQLDAYHRGVAAILKHIGRGAEFCAGHSEFARPRGRKGDPSFEMSAFRSAVAGILNGAAAAPVLIPAAEPESKDSPGRPRPTLRRRATGDFVKQVQKKLGLDPDGKFGPRTEAAVRAFQSGHKIVPDGIVGPKTWARLDEA
jgi:murein L,D-transpeptidase YcbB/YkuD